MVYFITGENEDACGPSMATAGGEVVLDGSRVTYARVDNEYVTYSSVKDNPLDGFSGRNRTYMCGLWVYLPQLAKGEHALSVEGHNENFSMSGKWTLIVG